MQHVAKAKLVAIIGKLQHAKRKAKSITLNFFGTRKQFDSYTHLQSPVPHLLRSNAPPTDAEMSAVRVAILAAEEEGIRLMGAYFLAPDTDLSAPPPLAKEALHKLDLIVQFIFEQKSILSLVRRLPLEILQEIFIQSLSPPSSYKRYRSSWSSSVLPWALSQVSQRWRNAALSTSVLWRQLPVIDIRRIRRNCDVKILTELLKRSHDMSIDVHVLGNFTTDSPHSSLDTLIRHSYRWRNLTIDNIGPGLSSFKNIKGNLSSLEKLTISFLDEDPVLDSGTMGIFQSAPKLYDVLIESSRPARNLILPMNQIVHFAQYTGYPAQMPHALASSSGLRTLELTHLARGGTIPDTTLQNLVSLKIDFAWGASHEWFIDRLTLPALETLSLESTIGNLITTVISLIRRSGSSLLLKALILESNIMSAGQLSPLLKLTPALNYLSITMPPVEDILALSSNQGDCSLAPLLSRCHFFVKSGSGITDEAIRALKVLAECRCESEEYIPDGHSMEVSQDPNTKPWQRFSMSFISGPWQCHRRLEGWDDTDVSRRLEVLGDLLTKVLPQISTYPLKKTVYFKRSGKEKVISVLNDIKTLKVEKASDLSVSGIYDKLRRLSNLFEQLDGRYIFSHIAKQILADWDAILEDNVKDVRWLSAGWSVMYLSRTSDIRLSENAANIFYSPGKWFLFERP